MSDVEWIAWLTPCSSHSGDFGAHRVCLAEERSSWVRVSTSVDSNSSMAAVAMAAASPLYVAARSAGLPSWRKRPLHEVGIRIIEARRFVTEAGLISIILRSICTGIVISGMKRAQATLRHTSLHLAAQHMLQGKPGGQLFHHPGQLATESFNCLKRFHICTAWPPKAGD